MADSSFRREKLKQLIKERFDDNGAGFGRAIGRSSSQVNHWLTGERNLGDAGSRHIEITLGLPMGYFDQVGNDASDLPCLIRNPLVGQGWRGSLDIGLADELDASKFRISDDTASLISALIDFDRKYPASKRVKALKVLALEILKDMEM